MSSGAMLLRLSHSRKYWDFDTISPHVAKELTATWLYGMTRYTSHQRKSRNAAMEHGFCLSVLTTVHGRVENADRLRTGCLFMGYLLEEISTRSPCSVPAENLRINPTTNNSHTTLHVMRL
ncbi:hypothetical protein ACXM2N_07235 [Corynebacterium sp. ZY180755]